jgi:hypothetical protein
MGIFSGSGKNTSKSTPVAGEGTKTNTSHYDTGQKATNDTGHTEHSWTQTYTAEGNDGKPGVVSHREGTTGANAPRTRD